MKISAASLLLAFAGFLQESKCMFSGENRSPLGTGNIEITLQNGHKLVDQLTVTKISPPWVQIGPLRNSETYDVLFHAAGVGNYQARVPHSLQESGGDAPKSVKITIGTLMYLSYRGLKKHQPEKEVKHINGLDHIYIIKPGTNEVYFELLYTEKGLESQMRMEQESEMRRKKRAENLAGQTSKTKAWGLK